MKFRPIALYLPQYHPIPENDAIWGEGFTEWMNVVLAQPRYKWHYQPHVPSDLGYYDLREAETRRKQAKLAQEHGLYGFCYYHYWSMGRRLLERPFQEVFESGTPDFPFMLSWANHDWTMRWIGESDKVFFKQEYSLEDAQNHIQYLLPIFKDPRYIKINGKPVFLIWRSSDIPILQDMLELWRREALKSGLELYLIRMESPYRGFGKDYLTGFDAAMEPGIWSSRYRLWRTTSRIKNNSLQDYWLMLKYWIKGIDNFMVSYRRNRVIDYGKFIQSLIPFKQAYDYKVYPGVFPCWDTTPRYKNSGALIVKNSSPELFAKWLLQIKEDFAPYSPEENFVFINAWNEWGEGSHLEPDKKFAYGFLEAVQQVFKN